MLAEWGTILSYPFRDPMAFVLLALVTGFFGFATKIARYGNLTAVGFAYVFWQGMLLWYSFHALFEVAKGNLKHFLPEFNDISDLTQPLRVSAALLVTWGPLLLLAITFSIKVEMGVDMESIFWGAPTVQEDSRPEPAETEDSDGKIETSTAAHSAAGEIGENSSSLEAPFGVSVLLLLALLWKVAYSPVALIVAALSSKPRNIRIFPPGSATALTTGALLT
jgi:hypothetical protein